MPQITLRVSEDLLEDIEAATGPETSRSAWLREAARDRLGDDRDEFEVLADELEVLEERVDALERELERGPLERLLRR